MKRILAAALLLLLLAGVLPARAQLLSCGLNNTTAVPHYGSETAYSLAVTDQCHLLYFQNTGAETVTLPPPGVYFPAGFTVELKEVGAGGLTLSLPNGGNLDNLTSVPLLQGQSVLLRDDGSNWWAHVSPLGLASCTASGASPQTCNGPQGLVTTSSLSTAASTAAAAYTVNNSWITAASRVKCTINAYSGAIHTNGVPVVTQCVPGAGTLTVAISNIDTANALSGTVAFSFVIE